MPTKINYEKVVNQKISVLDFLDIFSNEDECLELYFNLKFSGLICSKCGRQIVSNYSRISRKNRNGVPKKAFRCQSCRTYIYPLSDTIFRKSTIPLKSIFFIIYKLADQNSSVSAMEISGDLSISYKTTHRAMMLIRKVLYSKSKSKMSGTIEVDEAFIGGGSRFYNWSSISTRKQPIIGMVQRETGHVRVFLVPNRNAATINKLLRNNIEKGSTIYTDSWRGYASLSAHYNHEIIDHSKREWVRGNVHINSIESFWGHFKRNIKKAHIKISDKYVQLYVDEACWRKNSKRKSQMQLFDDILRRTFFSGFD